MEGGSRDAWVLQREAPPATEAGDHLLSSGEFNSSPLRLVTPSPVPAYSSSARSTDITALHRPPPRHLSPLLPAPLRLPVPTTLGPHQDLQRLSLAPFHLPLSRVSLTKLGRAELQQHTPLLQPRLPSSFSAGKTETSLKAFSSSLPLAH